MQNVISTTHLYTHTSSMTSNDSAAAVRSSSSGQNAPNQPGAMIFELEKIVGNKNIIHSEPGKNPQRNGWFFEILPKKIANYTVKQTETLNAITAPGPLEGNVFNLPKSEGLEHSILQVYRKEPKPGSNSVKRILLYCVCVFFASLSNQ